MRGSTFRAAIVRSCSRSSSASQSAWRSRGWPARRSRSSASVPASVRLLLEPNRPIDNRFGFLDRFALGNDQLGFFRGHFSELVDVRLEAIGLALVAFLEADQTPSRRDHARKL